MPYYGSIIQVRADTINVMDTCSYQAKDIKEENGRNRLRRLRICKEVKQQHFITMITLFTKKLP